MKDKIEQSYEVEPYSDDSFCFVERPWLGEGLQIEIVQPKQMLINNLKLKKNEKVEKRFVCWNYC